MKKEVFKLLAKLNKAILPSYSKRQLDLSKAPNYKWQSSGGVGL